MRFNRPRFCHLLVFLGLLVGLSGGFGCDANLPNQEDVSDDVVQRVESNLLPSLVEESQVMFRNLLNAFAVMPEICATPLAGLGSFVSRLPGLGRPTEVRFDDDDGDWALTWRNVVLGDNDAQLTVDTTTPRVDLRLIIRFRTQSLQVLQAIPFTLVPQTTLQLAGEPPSYAAGATAGFFIFQNAATGEWTVRWRALGTPQVFAGSVASETGVSRVFRRVAPGDQNTVNSLEVTDAADEIRFEETTAPTEEKGFTFFVRPGDRVIFRRLRTGPSQDALENVTMVRLGAEDRILPLDPDAEEFVLSSSLPLDPVATVAQLALPLEVLQGMLVGQDVAQNNCNPGEDQWRVRFMNRQGTPVRFEGSIRARDNDEATLRVTAVGACPAGSIIDNGRVLEYDCQVTDSTTGGYDFCLLAGNRLTFTPEINELLDPGFVFIGAAAVLPPSPDPFSIRFDVELTELQSEQRLEISDTLIQLRGNNDEDESFQLNPDQESLDPLCHLPGEQVQPRVRLIGDGEYATARFQGSAFELNDVEFTDATIDTLADGRRFPDSGELRLLTRVEEEIENTEMVVIMPEITTVNGQTLAPVDVIVNVQEVEVIFPDQPVPLTVE